MTQDGEQRASDRFREEVAELARKYRDEDDVAEWVLSNQLHYIREDIEDGEL